MSGSYEGRRRPVTDEQRERARLAREKLYRDIEAEKGKPRPPVTSPGKFSGPIGMDDEGNLFPPLTDEERERKEAIRRSALGEE